MDGPGEDMVKTGLAPVAPAGSRLIILGSLPGDASLAAARYYAHPANQFWRLLGAVVGEKLAPLDYQTRLDRLGAHAIGLWDVIGSARRRGSLDQAIRGASANPLGGWILQFDRLEAVAFNGRAAADAGRHLLDGAGVAIVELPSSSPANTMSYDAKLERWLALRPYCD